MLKIYLDWNIISYLKNEEYKDLRDYIAQVNEFFIFPYSRAHIQDLYQSKSPTNDVKFKQDLDTLTEICQTHLLEYNDNIDAQYPYECTPRQYIERESLTLQAYTSGFEPINFTELIRSVMDVTSFENIHKFLLAYPLATPIQNPNNGLLISNLWDALTFSLENFSLLLRDKKLEVEIYKSMCKLEGERSIQEMQNIDSSDIFDYLNELCIRRTNKNLTDTILSTLETINGINSYNYFLAEYTTLALCGYCRDKKRNILNIMTDALHAFYAMRCDVLVTKDDGMKKKAKAEFFRFNSPTRIIEIEELRTFLETELHNQYNLDYIQHEVIPKYSKGEDRGERKLAYKNVPSPIWGLFTNCIRIPQAPNTLALKVNLAPNGYIYYTELKHFFNLLMENMSDKEKTNFQKEVIDKFLTRNKGIFLSIRTFFYFKKWQIELIADPESVVPLPMIIVRKKQKIILLLEKIISKLYNK
ncbi:Uncharacterised protein [uncultured Bacteroides sp.]|uniref:hypothetical protein n=1 Tax=Bacteroides cellulolyticus TaxID=2981780 RepID=UPI0008231F98|nr:hypothetical protein [Bacteroides cellulolyticus]MCU6771602.1 hypothetical protein [Bacteroides cellulolyticus]SCH93729.1 Uncharacterised protein [uncultured Bacteroides sp.]